MLAKFLLLGLFIGIGAVQSVAASPPPAAALDSEEMQQLALINQYRTVNGLGALAIDETLNQSARWMSQDMASNDYFSHTDSLGRDPMSRMAAFGYTYNTWKGENLAAGVAVAQDAFNYWKNSDGHNANMLSPNFTAIGIARVYGEGTAFGWYWATDFGGQTEFPPPAEQGPVFQPAAPAPGPGPAPEFAPPTQAVDLAPAEAPAPVFAPEQVPSAALAVTPAPQIQQAAPGWWRIELQVKPWWDRLVVVDGAGSILAAVSRVAGTYLEVRGGGALRSAGPAETLAGGPLSARLWPPAFS